MASVHVPTINNTICRSPGLNICRRDFRRSHRFPLIAQVEYISDGHQAQATTLDIGSGGVLLKTDAILRLGQPVVVLIDWPALLDQHSPLRLVVFGKVLRSDRRGTAVGFRRYEFRLNARNGARLSA